MRLCLITIVMLTIYGLSVTTPAHADPCGLVPPLWAGGDAADQTPIKRIGVQRTYVFYRNGMETMVLRPGFSGKVDEFGMLIPFPSPPAIRKLPDNVFEQIAAAIDPPEVMVDLRPRRRGFGGFGFGGGGGLGGGGGGGFGGGLGFIPENQVRVIREEAVGMYEVAVLGAGSAKALKRWMDDHKYTFPSGMDVVCPDYIKQRWCFVAVKTKVKQHDAAQPRPGQRRIDDDLPEGSTFDGHVQAMGFRFKSRYLVVPMRLSVHNSGDLRNVVYLLSDTPSRIRHIPAEFVRRQVSGMKLFDQLTEPLPLRVIGGTIEDIPRARMQSLALERDPRPHNGVAAELFSSDIVAAKTRRLESESEVFEKELLKISEALDLRGSEIDRRVQAELETERLRLVRAALKGIEEMTLTVIDGDFPRDVLARENLTFAEYHMPLERSDRAHYDANKLGQTTAETPGTLVAAATMFDEDAVGPAVIAVSEAGVAADSSPRSSGHRAFAPWVMWFGGLATAGGLAIWRFPERKTSIVSSGTLLVMFSATLLAATHAAQTPTMRVLVKRLAIPNMAEEAAEQIVELGEDAVPAMINQSRSRDTLTRGWAIVCLGRIGGDEATEQLKRLRTGLQNESALVRSWSAAALVKAARTDEALQNVARLAVNDHSLHRPLAIAVREYLRNEQNEAAIVTSFGVLRRVPQISAEITAQLQAESTRPQLIAYLQGQDLQKLLQLASECRGVTDLIAVEYCLRIEDAENCSPLESQLIAASRSAVIARQVLKDVLAGGPEPLVRLMLQSTRQPIRRQAAQYLATQAQAPKQTEVVAQTVIDGLAFEPDAEAVPWSSGPLFIPGLPWKQDNARQLTGHLIRWHLWAGQKELSSAQRQIENNLRSRLGNQAGYTAPSSSSSTAWLTSWKRIVGNAELKKLLAEQGLVDEYSALLDAE